MIQRIGICGSHRSGKTTLATEIALKTGIPFVKTHTSSVFAQFGLEAAQVMDFKTRLWIQQQIMTAAETVWQLQSSDFITDRTPIDFMAYTLADIQGATDVDFIELEHYLQRCFTAIQRFFTTLVVLQPGIPLVYAEGKAALNRAYMEHLNMVVLGLCHDERLQCPVFLIERHILSLAERVEKVIQMVFK